MEPFIGQIIMFAGNFAPRGWALCDGQLLDIASHSALFSILGTTYGGDGRTTFGLPDLRGRVPMHEGSGPGLSPKTLGQKGGAETHTLTINEIPSHGHGLAGAVEGNTDNPNGGFIAGDGTNGFATANDTTAVAGVGNAGGGQAHNNMQPFQVVNFIIALVGTFPSRS